jgi:hypothetical protein
MYKAVHFDKLFSGRVILHDSGSTEVRLYSESYPGELRGKVAYLPLNAATDHPKPLLGQKDWSSSVWPKTGKKLYVCKESHIPRAIIRNSDYKITIDKDNADYIVIPAPKDEEIAKRNCNVAYIVYGYKTCLYYFNVCYDWKEDCNQVDQDDVQTVYDAIKDKIHLETGETSEFHQLALLNLASFDIYFVKRCEEVEQVLTGEDLDESHKEKFRIIWDTKLRIDSTNEISADMLQIWEKMDTKSLIAKSIIGSNWQQYPCTISVFIDYMSLGFYGGDQMDYILDSLDYKYYRVNKTFRPNKEIQPDDWNLLQDWLMLKAGVPKEGGFKVQKIEGPLALAHYAECFKPCKITEPTLYQEIEARLKI